MIAIDPSDAHTLFAASGGQVHKTTDDGATWTPVLSTGGLQVLAIAVSPADPNLVFVALAQFSASFQVHRSLDGGATWTRIEGPIQGATCIFSVPVLVPHPTDTSRVLRSSGCYAGRDVPSGDTLDQSLDQGVTWAPLFHPRPLFPDRLIGGMGSQPDRWYLSAHFGASPGGGRLFRSDDDGATWSDDPGLRERPVRRRGGVRPVGPGPRVRGVDHGRRHPVGRRRRLMDGPAVRPDPDRRPAPDAGAPGAARGHEPGRLATRPVSGARRPPRPSRLGRLRNPWGEPNARAAYLLEATQLTQQVMDRFWHADVAMFKAPEPSAEAVPSGAGLDGGYVFWPSIVSLHALAAGEWHWRFVRGASMYRPQIAAVFAGLERYFDPAKHAYNAWVTFPGNDDTYYDDNALAVVALVDCYEATQDLVYLDRAWEVMSGFVYGGWDPSGDPGRRPLGDRPDEAGHVEPDRLRHRVRGARGVPPG